MLRQLLLCALAAAAAAHSGLHTSLSLYASLSPAALLLDGDVTLSLNATLLARSGDGVALSWLVGSAAGFAPSPSDFIAYFVPADADVTRTAPVKFMARAPRAPRSAS